MNALRLRSPDACYDALAYQAPLEFCERTQEMEQKPAGRRGAVEAGVAERDEPDTEVLQLVEQGEQMLERAPEPVELPHDHEVEAPSAGVAEQPLQFRALGLRAAYPFVYVLADGLPPPLGARETQLLKLQTYVLTGTDG